MSNRMGFSCRPLTISRIFMRFFNETIKHKPLRKGSSILRKWSMVHVCCKAHKDGGHARTGHALKTLNSSSYNIHRQ